MVWQSDGTVGSGSSFYSVSRAELMLRTARLAASFTGLQTVPSVAMDRDDDFVAVWFNGGAVGAKEPSFQGQRFISQPLIFSDGFESGDTLTWN